MWDFCLQELILLSLTYVKLFVDYLDAIEPLSDAETGRLFISLMKYAKTGEAPQLSGNERFLFPMMRSQIDRDIQDYESYRKQQSENGKKGGRPPKKRENQKDKSESEKTDGFSEIREDNFESEKSKDKDKDKDKEEEKRKKYKEKEEITPFIPLEGYSQELQETFDDWLKYKKEKNQPYKPTGLKSLVTKVKEAVSKYGEQRVIVIIKDSMSANYQGILWDKLEQKGGQSYGQPARSSGQDANRRWGIIPNKLD